MTTLSRVQRVILGAHVALAIGIVLVGLGIAEWQTLLAVSVVAFGVSAVLWDATWTSEGNVMTDTELSALANSAISAASPAYDNSSKLKQYGILELNVDFVSAPSAGGYVNVYAILAPDGTNYGTTSTVAADVGQMRFIDSIFLPAVTPAVRLHSKLFTLMPGLMKFVLENRSGQAFPTSASSTLKLFTVADESQ